MTKFSFNQGPKILVTVTMNHGVIHKVHLQTSNQFEVYMNEHSDDIYHWCESYSKGEVPLNVLSFDFDGLTEFRKIVLTELQKISFGESASYNELAKRSHRENGARAVGGACGANPCPLFIPCHRILASDGSLGGFSQGLEIKKRLLGFEKISYRSN